MRMAWRVVEAANREVAVTPIGEAERGYEGAKEKKGSKKTGEIGNGTRVEGVRMRTEDRIKAACGARRSSRGRQGSDR